MVTRDPQKNKEYVAKHRAMKKANAETRLEYNQLNKSYIEKHNQQLKETLGTEEYNKRNAEKMREYRARQKQAKQEIQSNKSITLQNAIRNKLARKALLQKKQDKANEVISQINQKKKDDLIKKLNASVYSNDMLNNLFESVINQQPVKRGQGRPRKYV